MASIRLALTAGLALLAAIVAVASLTWPIGGDGPFLLYVGWLFSHLGLVPYRDIFLVNVPGALYPYAWIGQVFGFSEWGGRAGDLALLAMLALVNLAALRRFGWLPGVLAAALFVLVYLEFYAVERELLVALLLTAACAAVAGERPSLTAIAAAGLAIGAAACVRPPAALVGPAFLWYLADGEGRTRRWAVLVGAAALPALATLAWLWAVGALGPFFTVVTDYWPRYLLIDRTYHQRSVVDRLWSLATTTLASDRHRFWIVLVVAATVVLAAGWRRLDGPRGRYVRLLLLVAVALAIYPLVSGRLLGYRTLPLRLVVLQLVALATCGGSLFRASLREAAGVALLLVVVGVGIRLPEDWLAGWEGTRIETRGFLGRDIAADLCPLLRPGGRVQPLDWAEGTQHAMLICRARPATRFIFDYMLYQDTASDFTRDLRREFLAELTAAAPRLVVALTPAARLLVEDERSDWDFSAFDTYLATHYTVAVSRGAYTIYERR
ncbi:MAG: hypothetical protein AB7O67_20385 [Vicinamibacterales bacterium]